MYVVAGFRRPALPAEAGRADGNPFRPEPVITFNPEVMLS
jgi:hypothetical protein